MTHEPALARRTLLIGAGAAAGAAGLGLGWQRLHSPTLSGAAQAFWASRFTGLDGNTLDPLPWRGKPLLVNFWATWCPPCVKELPEINQFYGEARGRGWQVLGLAVDKAEPVREFLHKLPLDFPIALAGAAGLTLTRTLGNPAGGLPFSLVFDDTGEISWRRMGVTRLDELRALAKG